MISNDKIRNPARFWSDMPIVIGSSCSCSGRAQLLYLWLRSTGMDQMDEIKGMVNEL